MSNETRIILWFDVISNSLLPLVICARLSDPHVGGSSEFRLERHFSKPYISGLVNLNSTTLTQFVVKGSP